MQEKVKKRLESIIAAYNKLVQNIDSKAKVDDDRAYGGIIRAGKGMLVESIASELIDIGWCDVLNQDRTRVQMNKAKMPIGIRDSYIERIKIPEVKAFVKNNKNRLIYKFGTDVQVFIDRKLVIPIECKAYTENAMIKRIIFDAELMKEAKGIHTYFLLQLESQLGGDYCELNEITYGSPATHALLSHSDVDIEIITLLKGERKVDRPIHKQEYFKELTIKQLEKALNIFVRHLERFKK